VLSTLWCCKPETALKNILLTGCQWLMPVILAISRGRDQEDHNLKPAWANSLRDPTLKKINHKNRASGVAQGVGPEFKPHSTKKKRFLTNAIY
jgi:hypothetical protein